MKIFNIPGGLPPVAAEALYTYQTLLLNLRIVGSQNVGMQYNEGDCAHAVYADVEIGE